MKNHGGDTVVIAARAYLSLVEFSTLLQVGHPSSATHEFGLARTPDAWRVIGHLCIFIAIVRCERFFDHQQPRTLIQSSHRQRIFQVRTGISSMARKYWPPCIKISAT